MKAVSLSVCVMCRALHELGVDVTEETGRCLAKLFEYDGDRRRQAAVDYEKLVGGGWD